jgi:hypothetical protein
VLRTGAEAVTATCSFTYYNNVLIKTAATSNTATSGSNATSESFAYDDSGALTNATGSAGTSAFTHTADGQTASRADTVGGSVCTTGFGDDTPPGTTAAASVTSQRLHTTDFRAFQITQLTGPAAVNEGMAFFPRTIGGTYMALSRWDRESTSVVSCPDNQTSSIGATAHTPSRAGELTQVVTCGSPIEVAQGWLVLTHEVGPMRTYSIGAILLGLEHPERVVATLPEPPIAATSQESAGYVPNVVYSCARCTITTPS